MSSALKPALPPGGGGQTSPANPPSAPGKALTGAQSLSQHGATPAPYSTGPLGHMPQSVAGLPHAHAMPSTNSTNIAANMSINAMPTNMSINQTSPPLNVPNKGAVLPLAVTAAAGLGRQTAHPYLTAGSAAPTGAIQPARDAEGTTLPLPASQNSAQLMAMHRAQQQHQPVHNAQQPQPHNDQSVSDRCKQQQTPLQPQQSQSNGTVTGPSEPSTCNNKTTTVPATAAIIQADAAKTETPPSAVPSVQNHVSTNSPTTEMHEPNNDTTKQPQTPTPTSTAAVAPEVTTSTSASSSSNNTTSPATQPTPAVVDTKTNVLTPLALVEPEPAPISITITPTKTAVAPKEPVKVPTTLKLATTPRTTNRKRETKPPKASEIQKTSSTAAKSQDSRSPGAQNNKPPDKVNKNRTPSEDERKSKRTRTRTQPYQSPIPELALITKLSSVSAASSPSKSQDDKLIVFYKNEFLAVRNAEGGFYVCQAVQNVYKSSPRIRIRWLSKDKQDKIYIPDFYDFTDFDCILTNITMDRVEKGKYSLPKDELERTENILKRALAVESGASAPSLTEEHPDGLDLSLFRDESQLRKKRKSAAKRKPTMDISLSEDSDDSDYDSKPKRTPDKAKVRRVSRTSSSKSSTKRNNQSLERKSTTPNATNDKKENSTKTGRRSMDGGRAERAKRRGEGSGASIPKTSPVIDQKKARVLAKTMKTTIPAVTQSKKKVGRNAALAAKTLGNATASSVKTNTKTSTRSQVLVAASSSSTAAASSSVLSTRRGKKTKK